MLADAFDKEVNSIVIGARLIALPKKGRWNSVRQYIHCS